MRIFPRRVRRACLSFDAFVSLSGELKNKIEDRVYLLELSRLNARRKDKAQTRDHDRQLEHEALERLVPQVGFMK